MLNLVGGVLVAALAASFGRLVRRRDDVLRYHHTGTTANRVGHHWLWSRHGSR